MRAQKGRRVARGAGRVALLAAVLGASWWATSLRPFSPAAYLAVAAGATATAAARHLAGRRRSGPPGLVGPRASLGARALADAPPVRAWLPWAALGIAATTLEAVGLARGGRSRTVPTLSDVADRLLSPHPVDALAFAAWLVLGWWLLGLVGARGARREEA
jgi:hypothetical protein